MFKTALLLCIFGTIPLSANRAQTVGDALKYGLELNLEQKRKLITHFRMLITAGYLEQDALILARLSLTEELVDRNFDFFRRVMNLLHSMNLSPEQKYSVLRAALARLSQILDEQPQVGLEQQFYAIAAYAGALGRQLHELEPSWNSWSEDEIPILPLIEEPELPFLILTRRVEFTEAHHTIATTAYEAYLESVSHRMSPKTRFFRALSISRVARLFPNNEPMRRLFAQLYDRMFNNNSEFELTETEYFNIEYDLIVTLRDFPNENINLQDPRIIRRALEHYHNLRMPRLVLPRATLSSSF